MKSNIKLIVLFVCVVIMFLVALNFTLKYYNTKDELIVTQNDLQFKEDALLDTQEELAETRKDLQFVIEKADGLSTSLGNMAKELEDAQTVISDLKSEEYELVYIGNFRYTYYCDERYPHICGGGLGITASGKSTEVGWTVAADTSILPMGSIIYVEGVGFREVMDTGSAVNGQHIDILLNTHDECFEQTLVNGDVWLLVKKSS